MPLILLTNDDSYRAPGIRALRSALETLGTVLTVAPQDEMSAVSHGLTLNRPLRIRHLGGSEYAVDGTPADCVLVAINRLLEGVRPDLVVSGINAGANLGDDVMYSGTVAGAREGSMYGLSAVAFSLYATGDMDFDTAAMNALPVCQRILESPLPRGIFLNVNFPSAPSRGTRITRLCRKLARSQVHEKVDPRGRKYYWIGEDESDWDLAEDTDAAAVAAGYTSVTPLHRDQTSYDLLEQLRENFPHS